MQMIVINTMVVAAMIRINDKCECYYNLINNDNGVPNAVDK